jgi:hypothetical protein
MTRRTAPRGDTGERSKGISAAWITLLVLLLTFGLSTGLIALYGMNVPFPLDPYGAGYMRVRSADGGPTPLHGALVVLLLPVLAIEAAPMALLLHVIVLSCLYTVAVEGCARSRRTCRAFLLAGLGVSLVTPLPGVYGYPSPVPQVITLWPSILVHTILFFSHPLVRYALPLAAYALPGGALLLSRWKAHADRQMPRRRPHAYPAYLLAMFVPVGMLLVLLGDITLQLVGLILNWSVLAIALLLWVQYYRPGIERVRLRERINSLERWLYSWSRPTLSFTLLTALLLFLLLFHPMEEWAEESAVGHHVLHLAVIAVGLMQGGILYQQLKAARGRPGILGGIARFLDAVNVKANRGGLLGVLISASLLTLWHIPRFWDLALQNEVIHAVEHLSLLLAAGAIVFSLPMMPSALKYGLFLVLMVLASLLTLSLWVAETPVYTTYTVEELSELGKYHFLFGIPVTVLALVILVAAARRGDIIGTGGGG